MVIYSYDHPEKQNRRAIEAEAPASFTTPVFVVSGRRPTNFSTNIVPNVIRPKDECFCEIVSSMLWKLFNSVEK